MADEVAPERRALIKRGMYLAVAAGAGGVAAALWLGSGNRAPPPGPVTVPPPDDLVPQSVTWTTSGATSAWANDKAGQRMLASDFTEPGLGGPGIAQDGKTKVIVCYLDSSAVDPGMKMLEPYGAGGAFAAYRALCTHLPCTTMWRRPEEASHLVPVAKGHDLIVCPCHLSTYDPYDAGKVLFGPAPTPLEQIPIVVRDGGIIVRLPLE